MMPSGIVVACLSFFVLGLTAIVRTVYRKNLELAHVPGKVNICITSIDALRREESS